MLRPFHSATQAPSFLPLMMTGCLWWAQLGPSWGMGGEKRERRGPCPGDAHAAASAERG